MFSKFRKNFQVFVLCGDSIFLKKVEENEKKIIEAKKS
jgi:hypothetical protein